MRFYTDVTSIELHVWRCACRIKILPALLSGLCAFLLLLFFNIDTGGNSLYFIKGFLAYSNYIVMLFSGLSTVCIACYLFRMEIEHKHYYFSLTKTVSRSRVLFGHWLGIAFINVAVTAASSALILALVHVTLQRLDAGQRAEIREKLLCAKKILHPSAGSHPVIEKGGSAVWSFSGLAPETETVTLGLSYFSSSPKKIDPIEIAYRAGGAGRAVSGSVVTYQTVPAEIEVPASAIGENGALEVELTNLSQSGRSIYVEEKGGLTLSYPGATFTGNFMRLALFGLLRNCFIAAMALFLCSFLTFPVALISAVIYFLAGMSSRTFLFMSQQENVFSADLVEEGSAAAVPLVETVFKAFLKFLYYFSGRMADISPAEMLTDSRMLEWTGGVLSIYGLWLVYGAALAAAGAWIFTRTEISRLER